VIVGFGVLLDIDYVHCGCFVVFGEECSACEAAGAFYGVDFVEFCDHVVWHVLLHSRVGAKYRTLRAGFRIECGMTTYSRVGAKYRTLHIVARCFAALSMTRLSPAARRPRNTGGGEPHCRRQAPWRRAEGENNCNRRGGVVYSADDG